MDIQKYQSLALPTMAGTLIFYWDQDDGCTILGNQSELDVEPGAKITVDDLLNLAKEEDKPIFRAYREKVHIGFGTPGGKGRQEAFARLRKRDGSYTYHSVEGYYANQPKPSVTTLVRELGAEEVYRVELAKRVTNDLDSVSFNRAAGEIICRNPRRKYAVIQFDVAKFKAINKLYGEQFGDELLRYFVDTLKVICNDDQLYVRLTADVFMILTDYETEQDILDLVEMLNSNLTGYKDVPYRLVFGVCYVADVTQRLRKYGDGAAIARQSIKENAMEHVAFYREEMSDPLLTNKYMEDHMEQALEQGEFVVYLQPKYSIDSGQIVGAEALVRWFDRDKGMMPPMDFIPLFERNGFVTKLDAFVWEEACKTIRGWLDAGVRCVPVSVNMSRVHLKNDDFIGILDGLVEKYNIPKRLLEIELTESAAEEDIQRVAQLKERGYTLLMDDFGSAYSSLNTLKDTKFDTVKIDRLFFRDFVESDRGKEIIRHVISMTRDIGLGVMAEGVETREQAEFLLSCGCNEAQGFYYAKPMPVEAFNKLI